MKKRKKSGLIISIIIAALLIIVAVLLILLLGKDKDNGGASEEDGTGATGDVNGNGGNENGGDKSEGASESICLIENSKARFSVVYTSKATLKEKENAYAFVNKLKSLGIDAANPKKDTDKNVGEYEIIFGTGAALRGDECDISIQEIGYRGYKIKVIENKILIASGSDEYAAEAYDRFLSEVLGINKETAALPELSVKRDTYIEKLTEYAVSSVKIAGTELSEYTLVLDIFDMGDLEKKDIEDFRDKLFSHTGYYLNYLSEGVSTDKNLIIRYTHDAGDSGFRAYVSDFDLIIECSYANAFNDAFRNFAESTFFISGDVDISDIFLYEKTVSRVSYRDFGAVGDGIADDYLAIYNAHTYANISGQAVYAGNGAVYKIGEMIHGSIPVMTDVYLENSEIIYENSVTEPYLFDIKGTQHRIYDKSEMGDFFEYLNLTKGQAQIGWLQDLADGRSLVKVFGKNGDVSLNDTFVIDESMRVDAGSEVSYNLTSIEMVEVYSASDTMITFKGGTIVSSSVVPKILVRRSNVLIDGVECNFVNMPSDASLIDISSAYNVEINNVEFSVNCNDSVKICFNSLRTEGTNAPFILLDGAKNVEICNSKLSLLDASAGVVGLRLKNTELSSAVKLFGGSYFEADEVTVTDSEAFIILSRNSGAAFCGDIVLKDSELSSSSVSPVIIKSEYDLSDEEYTYLKFGYDLYMPKSVTFNNFTFEGEEPVVFSFLPDSAFDRGYRICERITYENMHSLSVYNTDDGTSELSNISFVNRTYPYESSE